MQGDFLPVGKISSNLKTAILAKGYSQNELAALANISHVTVSRYMSDTRTPGTEELYRMAKVLGVSMEFLLTGVESSSTSSSSWQNRALIAERKLSQMQEVLPLLGEVNAKLTKIAAE